MQVTGAILKKVGKLLAASSFDLAGGLREDEFNNFFAAHYMQQSPGGKPGGVYSGGGHLDELGLKYAFTIDAPVVATVAPLTPGKFSPLLQSWLASVPELDSYGAPPLVLPQNAAGTLSDPPPPNIQLRAPKMTLTITADDGSINPPAVLTFSMTATGFLSASTSGGDVTVTVVPIAVRLDDPGKFQKALVAAMQQCGFRDKAGTDPDCVSLQQLIRHIVNAVIAPQLSSFVKSFHFPVPIKLFNNVAILSVGLDVVDKLIVVFATVGLGSVSATLVSAPYGASPAGVAAAKKELLGHAKAMFKAGAGDRNKKGKIKELVPAASYPNKGLFLLLGQNFFQILANALLVYSDSKTYGDSWNGFFYSYGWSMRTWAPQATISGNNLLISVNVEGKASATVGVHTHCGDVSKSVSAQADALPASASTQFFFDNHNRELWMQFEAQPFTVQWTIGGLPWPFNQILGFLLDLFTNLGVLFISAFGLRWKQKLTTLPDEFPGTQLHYDLSLDQQVVADPGSGDLMVAGTINFKS
jgi:hypothetical protein